MDDATFPKDWLPILIWQKYFYRQQMDFINSPAWQRWFISANGCGKSLLFYWNMVTYGLGVHPLQFAKAPLRIRIIVPSFDNVQDVALVKLLEGQTIQPDGINAGPLLPHSMIKKGFSKDHKAIDLKNGTNVTWVTEEQGWKLMRGPEQDILGVDEECGERFFDENKRGLRNAKNGGKILGCFTPPYEEGRGPTWTKEAIVDASIDDPDIEVFRACMADNPAITEQFIKRFSKGKTKEQINVQVYGEYPSWGKTVHPFQNRYWNKDTLDGHVLPIDTPVPEDWDVDWVMAFDWHESKPTAAVWGWVDRDGNVIIFDELDKELAEDKEIIEIVELFSAIEGAPHDRRRWRRWQDPSAKKEYKAIQVGFNAWHEFRRHGIVTTEGKNRDPHVGISIMNAYFKGDCKHHPRIFIRENCKYTRQYLSNHYWKKFRKSDGSLTGKPDDKWSDYPICIRYILQEIGRKQESKYRRRKWPLVSYEEADNDKRTIDLGNMF